MAHPVDPEPPAAPSPAARARAIILVDQLLSAYPEGARQGVEALKQEIGAPHRVLALLIEVAGPQVIRLLRKVAEEPAFGELLGLKPPRPAGRPRGTTRRDGFSWAVAIAQDVFQAKPVDILRALGKETRWASGRTDYSWLGAASRRGQALRQGAEPSEAVVAFFCAYEPHLPAADLFETVVSFLATEAAPGVDRGVVHAFLRPRVTFPEPE